MESEIYTSTPRIFLEDLSCMEKEDYNSVIYVQRVSKLLVNEKATDIIVIDRAPQFPLWKGYKGIILENTKIIAETSSLADTFNFLSNLATTRNT